MAQNITLLGASYSAVPAVLLPKTGGGTARFSDASVTTAVASDVASGKKFLLADGSTGTGTAQGGSATVATAEKTPSSNSTSISFTVSGTPKMFAVQFVNDGSYLSGSSTRYITSVISDGTHIYSTTIYKSSNSSREYNYSTCTFSVSGTTLTINSPSSSTVGYFKSGTKYRLIYVY